MFGGIVDRKDLERIVKSNDVSYKRNPIQCWRQLNSWIPVGQEDEFIVIDIDGRKSGQIILPRPSVQGKFHSIQFIFIQFFLVIRLVLNV